MKKIAIALLGLAVALTWLWPLLMALSFQTTCTMGDDDSFAGTLLLCTLITVVALPLLLLNAGGASPRRMRLSVPVVTLVPLLFTLDHALATGIGAHHLCGPEYDSYIVEGGARNYYYPLMWAYALALSVAAAWPWVRKWTGPNSEVSAEGAS